MMISSRSGKLYSTSMARESRRVDPAAEVAGRRADRHADQQDRSTCATIATASEIRAP